jgi:hypothetical protein
MNKDDGTRRSILALIAAAFLGVARRSGGSLNGHPMPELREVGRELHFGARP